MTQAEALSDLLRNDVIPEIESYIDVLYEKIAAAKNATPEDKTQLEELQELKREFGLMLDEAESGEIDEEECQALIDEIEMMRSEDAQEGL